MQNTRISLPESASAGDIVEVKTLISHPMESGFRVGPSGEQIPRDIIERFRCTYDGETVFEAEFGPGIAANPFLAFHFVVTRSADVVFTWTDQHGAETTETRRIEVS